MLAASLSSRCSSLQSLLARPAAAAAAALPCRALATRSELAAAAASAQAAPSEAAQAAHIEALLAHLEAGLKDMVEANAPRLRVHRAAGELTVSSAGSAMPFVVRTEDAEAGSVSYFSPRGVHGGGAHSYVRDAVSEQWVSTTDGHFLLEILVRDLTAPVPGGLRGFPNF
jgi:hypothetical protein